MADPLHIIVTPDNSPPPRTIDAHFATETVVSPDLDIHAPIASNMLVDTPHRTPTTPVSTSGLIQVETLLPAARYLHC
jgi:hypothetical protein